MLKLKKQAVRVLLLSAALSAVSFTGLTRAADEPAKPAEPTQPNQPTRPRFNPADELKNYRDRFEDLNLSNDQMEKIDGFITTAEAEIKKLAGTDDDDSRREAFTAMRKLRDDVNSVLTDAQKAALQKKRTAMFMDMFKKNYTKPELNLTPDQTSKINGIFDDMQKQIAALTPGTDERENRRKNGEVMRAAVEKLNGVLTDDQKKLLQPFGFGRRPRDGQTTPAPAPGK